MRKNKYTKISTLVVMPLLLLLFWGVSSLIFNDKITFSLLVYKPSESRIQQVNKDKLLKGNKIKGEFKANDDNLGIIFLRFNDFVKHDSAGEDVLVFRLKEKDAKNWYYLNIYKSGLLERNLLFPFGIAPIKNSRYKTYKFEVESLYGTEANAIGLSRDNPGILIGYQYPKAEILMSKKSFVKFLLKKTFTSFTNMDFLLSSVLYMLPLLIYIFIYIFEKKLRKIKGYFLITVITVTALDIIFLKVIQLGIILMLIFIWILAIRICKLKSGFSFAIAFLGIIFWIMLIFFNVVAFQNKLNVWIYTFLVIGALQGVLEEKYNLQRKLE